MRITLAIEIFGRMTPTELVAAHVATLTDPAAQRVTQKSR
jgi:hypothetical protein